MVRTKQVAKPEPVTSTQQENGVEPRAENGMAPTVENGVTAVENGVTAVENGVTAVEPAAAAVGEPAAAAAGEAAGDATQAADTEKKGKGKSTKKKKAAAKQELGENGEEGKKVAPVKKVVPPWASLSNTARSHLLQNKIKLSRPKMETEVVNAIKLTGDSKGNASVISIKHHLARCYPDMPKQFFKKAVLRAKEKNVIKQTKGLGFSGSFAVVPQKAASGKKAANKKEPAPDVGRLDDIFPLVFTWATNPKEASVAYIRKYLSMYFPEMNSDVRLKKAIEYGEKGGRLERISGKGFGGTFALVDGAKKSGSQYDDAIESAIIAMNEPKEVSVTSLRNYLGEYHKEFNTDQRPFLLKKALERCSQKGWITQISGRGFSGSYRLNYPYYPSPRELWGEEYEEPGPKPAAPTRKRKPASSHSSEEEDSDDEVMPTPKKRGGGGGAVSRPQLKAGPTPAVKRKSAAPAAKGKPAPAKKSAKRPAKKSAKKTAPPKPAAAPLVIAVKSKPGNRRGGRK